MKTARFGYNLCTGSDLRFYLLIRVHNLIKSRFGFVPENTQELHKINILLQTFPRSVYLDDMSLVGPTGVLVLVLMLSGTQGRITADGK